MKPQLSEIVCTLQPVTGWVYNLWWWWEVVIGVMSSLHLLNLPDELECTLPHRTHYPNRTLHFQTAGLFVISRIFKSRV